MRRPHLASTNLSNLADQHYAISRDALEAARASHDGNWVSDNNAEFVAKHRVVVENDGPEDREDEGEYQSCEVTLGPGLCKLRVSAEAHFHRLAGDVTKDSCPVMFSSFW